METLTNVEVGKVFKGKSGEGQYGPWQIWDVYLRDDKRKLSYFEKDGFIPEVGAMIQVLKFEVVTKQGNDGKTYTNYNVKELTPDPNWYSGKEPETPPQTRSVATGSTISPKRDSSITMFVSYAKDLMVAFIGQGRYLEMDLEDVGGIVAQVGIMMYDKVNSPVRDEPAKEAHEQADYTPELEYPDEPPIGEPPPNF